MPELPEIFTLSEQMNNELSGRTISEVRVFQEKCLNLPSLGMLSSNLATEILIMSAIQWAGRLMRGVGYVKDIKRNR